MWRKLIYCRRRLTASASRARASNISSQRFIFRALCHTSLLAVQGFRILLLIAVALGIGLSHSKVGFEHEQGTSPRKLAKGLSSHQDCKTCQEEDVQEGRKLHQ